MILSQLFPHLTTTFQIERVVTTTTLIVIEASSRRSQGVCPSCGQASQHVHSRYRRQLWEQACVGRPVQLVLHVQRFRCPNPKCRRQTFAEPLEGLAQPHARRTLAQQQLVVQLGLALGGQGGARLAKRLGVRGASASTVLRLVQRAGLPPAPPVRVLGIDDWAWRRAKRYGTLLVDLERGQPVDVLEEYSSQAIARWLEQHPQVQVVVRDRSPVGRAAAEQAAPQAIQVADRFHLLKNLNEQLIEGFQHHPPARPASPSRAERAVTTPLPSKAAHYAQMQQLRAAGWSLRAIAQQVGLSFRTVHRWLEAGGPPARSGPVLRQRAEPPAGPAVPAPLGPRQAAWLFVQAPEALSREQCVQLATLRQQRAELEPLYQLVQRFVRLLAQREVDALAPWMQEAEHWDWSQLRQFVAGLRRDQAAVEAALRLPYSNGPVEGQVTRLKLLKRQMYGRAKLDLLRHRLLAGL